MDMIYGVTYMNGPAHAALRDTKPTYPPGAILVRERRLFPYPTGLEVLTVMLKREPGFNPAADDWEFLVVDDRMTKIEKREKTGSCQQCHDSQKDRDFVFPPESPKR
jgi:hypothetical protein